jgi:hypothetical protein
MTTPEQKAAYKKRLEEARDKKAPMKQNETILPDSLLRQCIFRFKTRPEHELVHFVEQWNYAALKYVRWLEDEGFTRSESVEILNAALERANLDMSQFPVCG